MAEGTGDLLNILVIDDDQDMRELLVRILLPAQHQVFAVGSAEEGLELLPYTTFQIAFLDQNLPGMEGLVLGEYLRGNNPQMQIALVTGSEDPKLDRLGEQLQITVIRKPFQVEQVLDLVSAYQEASGQRHLQRQTQEAPDFAINISQTFEALPELFGMPSIPKRIEERLLSAVRQSLTALRSEGRFNEQDRAIAYSGLLALQVLGVKPPKGSEARTLFEEFDALMRMHGRRREFSE